MSTETPLPSSNTFTKVIWLCLSIFTSAPIAVGYGLLLRLLIGIPGFDLPPEWRSPLGALSAAFLFLVPLAIGGLTVAFAPAEWRTSPLYAVGMPLVNCCLWAGVVLALNWEVFICILMALPLILPLAIVGGLLTWLVFKVLGALRTRTYAVAIFVILPYLLAPIESRFPLQDSFQTVETIATIHAAPAAVWRNVIRVPEIQPGERDFRLFHVMGAPWPMEATLAQEGLGGLRAARYENGLRWAGPVTVWQPDQTVSFDIHILDPETLPPPYTGLGKALDFQKATFMIEPLAEGGVRLHLMSNHRLTTRFNDYGGLWTRFFVNDIQGHILQVIKLRAEAGK